MVPADRSPHGEEILHTPPDEPFPVPAHGEGSGSHERTKPREPMEPDIAHRPALPEHPEQMAADIEDEEDDPVVDTGPGIADGFKSLKKQKG